ncbi:ankyrin [Thozetella sp. PMI_491]|nr:ankyrin [Thozetella sp. PMI_491]
MPLHWAVRLRDSHAVRLLIEWNADVNARDPRGQTPIMIAANRKFGELVDILMDAGADINVVNHIGESPLYVAVQVRATSIIQSFLGKNAVPVRRNRDGETELHSLVPFRDEIVDGHIVDLLIDAGFRLDALSYRKWSPAMSTLRFSDPVGLRFFISRGADLSMTDADGKSVLHLAALYSGRDVMRILTGNLSAVDLNLIDADGKTAMDYWRERCATGRTATQGDELISEDDLDAFEALIESILEVYRDDLEGEVVFHDAVEFLHSSN